MASRSSIFEAKAAARMQSCALLAENRMGSPSVSWFLVSVPVLSEHRISTPAISSMADSLETIAFCFDSASAPKAMVMENTADAEVDQGAKSSQTHTCGAGGYSSGDQPNPSRLVELLWSLYPVSFATDMALRQRHIGCVGQAKVQALQGCEDTGWPID